MIGTAPFLRWAGGKRWIAPRLVRPIREALSGRFIEPFLGSGAMFFALAPENALLGDQNQELMDVYAQVTKNSARIETALADLKVDRKTYLEVRSSRPKARLDRAIRFIYLNRTCFGGLHRTNRNGDFNVPYGGGQRTPEVVYRQHLLKSAACLLRQPGVSLRGGDFQRLVDRAVQGDVVFCDPTYRSAGRGRFDRYGPIIFSWDDQIRLARAAFRARARGAVVIVMNAADSGVRSLYDGAAIFRVSKSKSIGNRPNDVASAHHEIVAVLDIGVRTEVWAQAIVNKTRSTTKPLPLCGVA